jgi:predicted TIM-barrel fold metal-dependent hydrolase
LRVVGRLGVLHGSGEAPPREPPLAGRICFGSDWPFYPQAIGIAKVLVATEDDPVSRRELLHDNTSKLLGLSQG